jgi:hypothetical protein
MIGGSNSSKEDDIFVPKIMLCVFIGRDILTGTTTSEATHAQGEETVEDAENTEHDISAAAESLEPTSESQVQEGADDEAGLDDIMEQLLDRYAFIKGNLSPLLSLAHLNCQFLITHWILCSSTWYVVSVLC